MTSTREVLAAAAAELRAAGVPTPEVDAELLLAHVTGRPRALLRLSGSEVPDGSRAELDELIAARVARIPLQHLTGRAPFRHLEVRVGPGVFIPRPETELMVDQVIAFASGVGSGSLPAGSGGAGGQLRVVDLCTGSGALALSIAIEIPGSRVLAVELSDDAVRWARGNIDERAAELAAAGSTVELIAADAICVADPDGPLAGHRGLTDVVVTNPPYVPRGAVPREPEVRDHDPDLALYGGADGLEVIRPLARQAALLLRPGGLLVIEHADLQGEDAGPSGVPSVLRAQADGTATEGATTLWQDVADHVDLAGRPRHTSAIRRHGQVQP